jgi:tripartite-type tricarboxylate transporter receptor subunit TctC
MNRSRRLIRCVVLAVGVLAAPWAAAQACPDNVVKMIVPFAPGTTDRQARALAQGMEKALGQTIVVETRGGAGGSIGTMAVARAAPDGCTLLYSSLAPLTVVPLVSRVSYGYDDLVPVAKVMASPHLVAIRSDAPYKNLEELIAYAKTNPAKVNFGSSGTGTAVHLAGMAFAKAAAIEITHVPFQGLAPAITAALGGHVDLIVGLPIAILPQAAAGKLRPLVQLGATRSPALPDIPTAMEKGIKVDLISNHGIFVPKGTPAATMNRVQRAVQQAMESDEWRQFVKQHNEAPLFGTAADFKREVDVEKELMVQLVKEFNVQEKP